MHVDPEWIGVQLRDILGAWAEITTLSGWAAEFLLVRGSKQLAALGPEEKMLSARLDVFLSWKPSSPPFPPNLPELWSCTSARKPQAPHRPHDFTMTKVTR